MKPIDRGIHLEEFPTLNNPLLIAGFDGWGNALNLSKGMAGYLTRKLKAKYFARFDSDPYYRYDERRPWVSIEDGRLTSLSPPGGSFYAVPTGLGTQDLVILSADEPHLQWFLFVETLLDLCRRLQIRTLITVGSMYDQVLHTDRVVSGIASSEELLAKLQMQGVDPVAYQGPSAVHSLIQSEGPKRGIDCISLWCHCPHYLQGATHFGLLAHLGTLLASLGGFELDTRDLEDSWHDLKDQIDALIEANPEIQRMVNDLRKAKVRGSWAVIKESLKKDEKVINFKGFLGSEIAHPSGRDRPRAGGLPGGNPCRQKGFCNETDPGDGADGRWQDREG